MLVERTIGICKKRERKKVAANGRNPTLFGNVPFVENVNEEKTNLFNVVCLS